MDLFDGPTVDGDLKNVTDVLENNKCSLQECGDFANNNLFHLGLARQTERMPAAKSSVFVARAKMENSYC